MKRYDRTIKKRNIKLCNAIAVSFVIDNVECLLEDYEYEGEFTEKTISNTRKRIEVVKGMEKGFKEVLGVTE